MQFLNAYSYRRDWIGSCIAAFLAGAIPKIKPTDAATPNDNKIELIVITVGIPARVLTNIANVTPRMTPMIPPVILIIMASNKN